VVEAEQGGQEQGEQGGALGVCQGRPSPCEQGVIPAAQTACAAQEVEKLWEGQEGRIQGRNEPYATQEDQETHHHWGGAGQQGGSRGAMAMQGFDIEAAKSDYSRPQSAGARRRPAKGRRVAGAGRDAFAFEDGGRWGRRVRIHTRLTTCPSHRPSHKHSHSHRHKCRFRHRVWPWCNGL